MPTLLAILLGFCSAPLGPGAEAAAGARHGVAPDAAAYPQQTPRQAVESVLKAAEAGRFDYLVAQLADPAWVDDRVKRLHGGRFAGQVEETRARLDAAARKLLGRFLMEGEWSADDGLATARLKDVPGRVVRLHCLGGRWYLEHRDRPE